MKPKPFVQLQALTVAVLTALGLLLLGTEAATALGILLSVAAILWSIFGLRYRLLRAARQRRPRGHADGSRSVLRTRRDRIMLGNFVLGLLLPAAASWIVASMGNLGVVDPLLEDTFAVLLALGVIGFPVSMLVSSSIDWYLIRPFREGMHDDPVCQPRMHHDDRTLDYSRYWVGHRALSELICYLAVVAVVITVAVLIGEATKSETGENLFNGLGILGVAVWGGVEMLKLRSALLFVRRPSDAALGAWVSGQNPEPREINGFVLDVAVDPGVQLIDEPRGYGAGDISIDERSIPLAHRRSIKRMQAPRELCPGRRCKFWVPDCEIGLRQREQAVRSRTASAA